MPSSIWHRFEGIFILSPTSSCSSRVPQLFGLVADNASNNDTLVEELSDSIDSFEGSTYRIRCIAHILNLVVKVRHHSLFIGYLLTTIYKAILSAFTEKITGDAELADIEVPDDDDDNAAAEDVDIDREAADALTVEEVATEVRRTHPLTAAQLRLARISVSKVRVLLICST